MSVLKGQKPTEDNLLSLIISRYLPYWPFFLLICVLCGAAGWGYLRISNPVYESTARIMIKDEKKGAEDSKTEAGLNLLSPKKIIENETEVIQSRTLIEDVVRDLGLNVAVSEQNGLKSSSGYTSSPIKIVPAPNTHLKARDKTPFKVSSDMQSVIISGIGYPLNQWANTPFGKFSFIVNPYFEKPIPGSQYFFSITDSKDVVLSIQNALKVTVASKQSSILTLTLRDEIPQRAEDILNRLLIVYNSATLNDKNVVASNTLASVEERLHSVERELDSIERKAGQYKARKGAVDISEQGKIFLQAASSNDQKLREVNTQLTILSQAEQYVQSKDLNEVSVPSMSGISDPILPGLIDKLYTLELDRESLKKTTGENSAAMVSLNDRIAKIKPSVLESILNLRNNLEASSRNMSMTMQSYNSMLQAMPEKEKDLIEINRDLSIKNSIYTFLLQKREETVLSRASIVADSRTIDKAQSASKPVEPKPKVVYLCALMFGVVITALIVTLRETFSSRIMFRDEIQVLCSAPIIGEISANSPDDPIVMGPDERTFIAEQFRKVRTSLHYIGVSQRDKKILVTSAISGEGKSFVSINLAISLALTGKKVIIIDADLHNPSLQHKLDIYPEKGLSTYLNNEAVEQDIICQTTISPNLFFISTGKLPSNPSELLMNSRMKTLIDLLDTQYDYIVVDTAPVGLVTDAYIISPFCDATVFVIRHKFTPKAVVEQMDEENEINQLKNIGIIFNDVHSRGFGKERYGAGYGKGYIYNDKKYYRLT